MTTPTKTCIVCGKKFSTLIKTIKGKWQVSPHKKTCSPKCSDLWHNKLRHQRPEQRDAPVKKYKTRKVYVLARCPYCGVVHDVIMERKPIVMPRIYCRQHEKLREQPELEVSGMAGSRITRHAGAM